MPAARPLSVVIAALASLTVAACQSEMTQVQTEPAPGICRRDAAEALAGKDRVVDAQVRQITGASIVRPIKPGHGVTMDYRQERVTIETDPKTGKITRAFCG